MATTTCDAGGGDFSASKSAITPLSGRRVAYASIGVSLVCLAAMASVLPLLHRRLDSTLVDIQTRMEAFRYASRGVWRDIVVAQQSARAVFIFAQLIIRS